MWFDSHAHFPAEADARADLLARAKAAGVDHILAIGGTPELNANALAAAGEVDWVRAAVGMDRTVSFGAPGEVAAYVAAVRRLVDGNRDRIAAIGELGLDYHYDRDCPREAQRALFSPMLELAREYQLPVVIHCREAATDVIAALADHAGMWTGEAGRLGVVHCFTENEGVARALVELGYHIGISGIVTFKNAGGLRAIVPQIPDDRLLIETDAPFLAPVPFRGQTNEPAYVVKVGERVAELKGMRPQTLAALTTANARRLFKY